ncbi:MAG: Appr-p processing domain protein [Gemmatimonadetes bacterium]|nr:Appr-p processing domain protein [Gemmatimonadota bacterium]
MIELRVDDLAFFEGDAIVRPTNDELRATTPVMRRLEIAGGSSLLDRLQLTEPLPVGAGVATGAGELGVELLIHGVVQSSTERATRDGVRRALTSCLQRTVDFAVEAVAIAPFGLGAGNLAPEESADVMVPVISQHLQRASYPRVVTIILETDDEQDAFSAALRREQP